MLCSGRSLTSQMPLLYQVARSDDLSVEILILGKRERCLELAMLYRPTERDDEA